MKSSSDINYRRFGLKDLYESADQIDKEKYPECYREILESIEVKEKEDPQYAEKFRKKSAQKEEKKYRKYIPERLVALFIDSFCTLIFWFMFLMFVYSPNAHHIANIPYYLGMKSLNLTFSFPIFLLFNAFWLHHLVFGKLFQGSLGKRIMGIKLVNKEGKLRFVDLVKRYLIFMVLGIVCAIAVMFGLSTKNNTLVEELVESYNLILLVILFLTNIPEKRSVYDEIADLNFESTRNQNKAGVGITSPPPASRNPTL